LKDYSIVISNQRDFDTYINGTIDPDINKVILFTDKNETSNVFKALTAEFRDSIRMYVIHVKDTPETEKFEDRMMVYYGVQNMPALVVQ
jgi:hypothetical protein